MAGFASAVEGPAARPVIYTMRFELDMVQHALAQAGKKPAGVDYPNLVSQNTSSRAAHTDNSQHHRRRRIARQLCFSSMKQISTLCCRFTITTAYRPVAPRAAATSH
jgi:hypothetical protein